MKQFLLFIMISIPFLVFSQEQNKKIKVKISGFIRNDMTYNTRQVESARGESSIQLLPKGELLDMDDKDINATPNFNISALTSKMRLNISGPNVFRAVTSGVIETDFSGSVSEAAFNLRLRHAFMIFDWENTSLTAGQTWHPLHPTECTPSTISPTAGAPFHPLARNPQIKLTHKFGGFSILGAILSQSMSATKAGKYSMQNGIIPEVHLQLNYKNENLSTGIGINYQSLRPNLQTNGYINKTRINSLSYFAYAKLKSDFITAKLYALYGQNNDNLIMIGGYYQRDMVYSPEDIKTGSIKYDCNNVLSTWLDLETTGKILRYGLFAGCSQNYGAENNVFFDTYVGRWGNIKNMMRIAPRVKYISNTVVLGFELEYQSVAYAKANLDNNGILIGDSDPNGINKKGVITNSQTSNNLRILLSLAYNF